MRRLLTLALCAASALPLRAQMGYIVGTWAAAPVGAAADGAGKTGETLREIVHVSIAGQDQAHITLSNEFGHEPLTVGAATIAHRLQGNEVDTPSAITFARNSSVTIPPGKRVMSDLIHFKFPAQSDVAISLYIPAQPMTAITIHKLSMTTNYIAPGDETGSRALVNASTTTPWRYLVELDVSTATQRSVVCLGASIVDGYHSTPDANHRWPDFFTARLQKRFGNSVGVLNEGISGNRILHEKAGPSALERFDRDVLDKAGYPTNGRAYVILFEGSNDIGESYDLRKDHRDTHVTLDDIIIGERQLIARAHTDGLKIYAGTLTPFLHAAYGSSEGETIRMALNTWMRTSGEFDGVIDFDKALRDPADPGSMLPAYDSGDHLHPNDAGYQAMANAIDLNLFQ